MRFPSLFRTTSSHDPWHGNWRAIDGAADQEQDDYEGANRPDMGGDFADILAAATEHGADGITDPAREGASDQAPV